MKFLGRLFLCGVIVIALVQAALAGTERITNQDTVEVDVVSKGGEGSNAWTHRKAKVHPFGDGRIVVCEEFKDKVVALCVVLVDDGDVVLAPTRLLEEKT